MSPEQVVSMANRLGLELYAPTTTRLNVRPKERIPEDLYAAFQEHRFKIINIILQRQELARKRISECWVGTNAHQSMVRMQLSYEITDQSFRILIPVTCKLNVNDREAIAEIAGEMRAVLDVAFCRHIDIRVMWPTEEQVFNERAYQETKRVESVRRQRAGVVYVIASEDGYCKIGRAKNLNKRIAQIKLQMPFKVRLVHSVWTSDCVWGERFLHKQFRYSRMNGEWFKLSAEDIQWIKSLTSLEPGE